MKNKNKKYQIILADPPWHYNDRRNTNTRFSGGAMKHYPVMKIEEIKGLPVSEIADDDCLLFLWATFPNLKEALEVIEAWGFKYKTLGFAWIKTNRRQNLKQQSFLPTDMIDDFFGIGFYTKSNCEVCLIGVKGKPSNLIISNDVPSTIISPRREHSRKPDEAKERIIKLVGDAPRIELFSRQKTEGWDVWGNEVKSDINLEEMRPSGEK